MSMVQDIDMVDGDLSDELVESLQVAAKEYGLAIDTETSGLDPREDKLHVVTIGVPDHVAVVALRDGDRPVNLTRLLRNEELLKVFHNALFDLSFLTTHLGVAITNVYCTKVAARIGGVAIDPTLQFLVAHLLGTELNKGQRLSNWAQRPLSSAQLDYAASDVRHLHELRRVLSRMLSDRGETELFESCMTFLPSRVRLGMRGLNDVFAYSIGH